MSVSLFRRPYSARGRWARALGLALALGAGLAAGAGPVVAQNVLAEPLTDLGFSVVYSGGAETVSPSDPGAAKYRVYRAQGTVSPLVSITFSLPASLASGGDALAVAYGSTSAAWADQDGGALTTFDPQQGLTIVVPPDDDLYIWVGGTATATSSQPSGAYAGTLSLSITEL